MKFSIRLFGYSKKQVDNFVESIKISNEILEKNVEYLKQRCDELEKQTKPQRSQEIKEWQVDKSVVLPIKKTLNSNDEDERFV